MHRKSSGEREEHPLVEQGWKDMEAILNREMPVGRQRRRLFWPFIFLGVLMLGVVGWQAYLQTLSSGDHPVHIPLMEKEASEISPASQKPTSSNGSNVPPQPAATIPEEVDLKTLDKTKRTIQQPVIKQDRAAVVPALSDQKEAASRDTEAVVILEEPVELTNNTARDVESLPENLMDAPTISDRKVGTGDRNRGEEAMVEIVSEDADVEHNKEELIYPDTRTLVREPYVFVPILPETLHLRDKTYRLFNTLSDATSESEVSNIDIDQNKVNFGLTIGGIIDAKFSTGSWDLGLSVDYALSDKWHVGVRPSYWRINSRRDFFYRTQTRSTGSDPILSMDPDEAFKDHDVVSQVGTPSNSSVVTEISTDVLHYLRVPIYLQYHVGRRWRTALGFSSYYLLAEGGAALELNAVSNAFSAADPSVDLVKRNNYSVDLTIDFLLADNLRLSASYAHGLGSHLNYEVDERSFSNLHRYYRIGVDYSF